MKRLIAVLAVAAGLAIPAGAVASPANDNAQCGTDAASGAFLAGEGNYGFLGEAGGTPGYHGARGQEPGATGYKNSQVCGNR
jgi:hypothetical protein